MSRRVRQNKTSQQIKEELINFLLEDVEKNLDEYKKALEIKDKQLSDIKKILITAKKSYDKVVSKNKELRNYIENVKQRYSHYQQQQQAQYIQTERDYYTEKQPKKYKKVIYEEELDSEPEVEDNDYASEEIKEEAEKTKTKKVQQK